MHCATRISTPARSSRPSADPSIRITCGSFHPRSRLFSPVGRVPAGHMLADAGRGLARLGHLAFNRCRRPRGRTRGGRGRQRPGHRASFPSFVGQRTPGAGFARPPLTARRRFSKGRKASAGIELANEIGSVDRIASLEIVTTARGYEQAGRNREKWTPQPRDTGRSQPALPDGAFPPTLVDGRIVTDSRRHVGISRPADKPPRNGPASTAAMSGARVAGKPCRCAPAGAVELQTDRGLRPLLLRLSVTTD